MTETQTVDLAAWLTRIWDEEERLAREALEPDWQGSRTFYDVEGAQQDSWGVWLFHIHPDSVLARIAADRKILELHSYHMVSSLDSRFKRIPATEHPCCIICASQDENGERWPCETVRLLASPYKGREGWQEDWE